MVHLDLAPPTKTDSTNKKAAGMRSQKEKLFIRGKLISGDEHIRGINQFLKPPIKKGIIKKNTITTLCPVVVKLKVWLDKKFDLGLINSQRSNPLIEEPTNLKNSPKNMYRVPMSL